MTLQAARLLQDVFVHALLGKAARATVVSVTLRRAPVDAR